LDEIAQLQDGWLDGEGLTPNRESLSRLTQLFENHFEADLPLPFLYPTPNGGMQAEWSLGKQSITLEVNIDQLRGEYHALNIESGDADEETLNLQEAGGWGDLNARLRALEQQSI
jgi:hypothetical protein